MKDLLKLTLVTILLTSGFVLFQYRTEGIFVILLSLGSFGIAPFILHKVECMEVKNKG